MAGGIEPMTGRRTDKMLADMASWLHGVALFLAITSPPLTAQVPAGDLTGLQALEGASPGDTVWVTPRSRFDANFIQRFFLGDGYRDLWAMPVQVPILDLEKFAGGLTPTRRGGGLQTPSIRLHSVEGPVYTFRSLDKDASRALDPELRESLAAKFAQDFVSAVLPQGALILDRLQEAAGVLHAKPQLVLMPDDPRLAEFREDFAGVLGWIEVRADEGPDGEPGFAGADDVKGSGPFMEALEESPRNRVNSRAYLKARLLDGLVGDWDRHPDQWRWAGFREGGGIRYEPVPRDRDWALTKLDGFKMQVSKPVWPFYVGFDHEYPRAFRLTWNGRVLDRLIFPDLVWEDWEAVARELMESFPDPVIEEAVLRLPPPHFEAVGLEITGALKNRRDKLMEYAREYYLLQAEAVDIHATDEEELVVVDRLPNNELRVTVYQAGPEGEGEEPYYERVFSGEETDEVRVYLHGGDDEARIQGLDEGGILLTVAGGGGDDILAVAGGGKGKRVRFFDDRGNNRFEPGPSTKIDENSYSDPHDRDEDPHWAGTRDWGASKQVLPHLLFRGDGGLLVGASLIRIGYGFRHYPYRTRSRLTVGFGTGTKKAHVAADTEFPIHQQSILGHLRGVATGAYVHRFYGFGNETPGDEDLDVYRAFAQEYRFGASAIFRMSPGLDIEAGAEYAFFDPDENAGTLLAQEVPYGFESFNSVSLNGTLRWDGRDDAAWPTKGTSLEFSGRFFPELGDVVSRFGNVKAVATGFMTARNFPLRPTLALRAGGEKIWGNFPYQEAAVLGGSGDIRGFPEERFSGDASLFFSSELRFHIGSLPKLLPGSWGAMASAETGRVWVDGEDSDRWHGTYGGGLWVSIIDNFTLTLSAARSREGTRFLYGGGGFHF